MSGDALPASTFLTGRRALAALVAGCAASLLAAPGMSGIFGALLLALALAIARIDAREMIIPDWMNAALLAFGLLRAVALAGDVARWSAAGDALLRGAALGCVLLLVRLAYRRLRHREGLGLGDVKLGFAGGVWIEWTMLPVAIEIAALSALAVFLLAPKMMGRTPQWSERLPFGAFLAPAIWAAWLIAAWLDR